MVKNTADIAQPKTPSASKHRVGISHPMFSSQQNISLNLSTWGTELWGGLGIVEWFELFFLEHFCISCTWGSRHVCRSE